MSSDYDHTADGLRTALEQNHATHRATRRAHVFSVLTVLLGALALALSNATTFTVWRHDTRNTETLSAKVDSLERDLDAARSELQAYNAEAAELAICNGEFATLLQDTSYTHETAIGRLQIAILDFLTLPIEARDPGPVQALKEQARTANQAYENAVTQRAEWTAAGSPLPCPI